MHARRTLLHVHAVMHLVVILLWGCLAYGDGDAAALVWVFIELNWALGAHVGCTRPYSHAAVEKSVASVCSQLVMVAEQNESKEIQATTKCTVGRT